jgi:galactose mutarotase-like enzyme
MERIILENASVKAGIRSRGAELCSLSSKISGLEYLWQADSAFWPRHAPILFPIVGRLKDGSFRYNDESYKLPQHGFARDLDFELVSHDKRSAQFRHVASDETMAQYPFDFELMVYYILSGNSLAIRASVTNNGKGDMPFSIGFHPAFNCPLLPEENFEDYYLEFDRRPDSVSRLLKDGLFSGKTNPIPWQHNILPLQYSLFDQDAIVFENHGAQSVTLRNHGSAHSVQVGFQSFPYLGIWTKPGAPFLCIEPWFGLADSESSSGNFLAKEAIISLPHEIEFSCAYTITIE